MAEIFLWLLSLGALLGSAAFVLRRWQGEPTVADAHAMAALGEQREWFEGLQKALHILNINLRPVVFIAGTLLSSVAVCSVFLALFPEQLALAVVAGIALIPLSGLLMKDLVAWRARRFETALVDVVDLMHAATAGGAPPLLALQVAADASQGFVREAVEEVVRRLKLGASIESATNPLLQLYASEGVRLFVNTLTSRWHAGGDFAGLLAALGSILRERSAYRQRLLGQLSGARYALLFTAFFPYVLIPFFLWKEPTWLTPLTNHSLGPMFMLSALVCQVLGFLWMRRILRSDE